MTYDRMVDVYQGPDITDFSHWSEHELKSAVAMGGCCGGYARAANCGCTRAVAMRAEFEKRGYIYPWKRDDV